MPRAYINNALRHDAAAIQKDIWKEKWERFELMLKQINERFHFERRRLLRRFAFATGKMNTSWYVFTWVWFADPIWCPKWLASTKTRKKPESLSKASSMWWWYSIIISRASPPLGSIDVFQYRLFASLKIYFQEIDFFVNKFGRNTVRTGSWQGS